MDSRVELPQDLVRHIADVRARSEDIVTTLTGRGLDGPRVVERRLELRRGVTSAVVRARILGRAAANEDALDSAKFVVERETMVPAERAHLEALKKTYVTEMYDTNTTNLMPRRVRTDAPGWTLRDDRITDVEAKFQHADIDGITPPAPLYELLEAYVPKHANIEAEVRRDLEEWAAANENFVAQPEDEQIARTSAIEEACGDNENAWYEWCDERFRDHLEFLLF